LLASSQAVSTKDWDALLKQMHTILATENEVAMFIAQQFQQLANDAYKSINETNQAQSVRGSVAAFRASLAAERQELIKQELSMYDIV
jgi:hypothetical protein